MTDPISLRSTDEDRWGRAQLAAAGAATRPTPDLPARLPPALPSAPARDVPLPARFLELTATRAEPARIREARDVETQRRLDATLAASQGPYRTPDGKVLRVGIPFRMTNPYPRQGPVIASHLGETAAAAASAHLSQDTLNRIECGRGTPEEVHALTQALIDAQPRGDGWDKVRVQKLMFEHGIGIDCAGYAQQALLRATGMTRSQAHLGPLTLEDLSGLARKGFTRIGDFSDVRPGDVVVLGAQHRENPHDVGHRAIVYDQRLANAADMRMIAQSPSPAERAFAVGGPIRVFELDASWGSHGKPELGGVKRETWLYDETKQLWGTHLGTGKFVVGPTPYEHPFEGFYRKGA